MCSFFPHKLTRFQNSQTSSVSVFSSSSSSTSSQEIYICVFALVDFYDSRKEQITVYKSVLMNETWFHCKMFARRKIVHIFILPVRFFCEGDQLLLYSTHSTFLNGLSCMMILNWTHDTNWVGENKETIPLYTPPN